MPGSPQLPCSISERQEEEKTETKGDFLPLLEREVHVTCSAAPPPQLSAQSDTDRTFHEKSCSVPFKTAPQDQGAFQPIICLRSIQTTRGAWIFSLSESGSPSSARYLSPELTNLSRELTELASAFRRPDRPSAQSIPERQRQA